MKTLTSVVTEKLTINKELKQTWAQRYKTGNVAKRAGINKFKKFFNEMKELTGLIFFVWKDHSNLNDYGNVFSWPYKIRENEPDKNLWNTYDNIYTFKTYNGFLELMFDESHLDIHDEDDIYNSSIGKWCLCIRNVDESKSMLKKLGFEDIDSGINKYYTKINNHNDWMFITFKDLYENIDNIYKEFFE